MPCWMRWASSEEESAFHLDLAALIAIRKNLAEGDVRGLIVIAIHPKRIDLEMGVFWEVRGQQGEHNGADALAKHWLLPSMN